MFRLRRFNSSVDAEREDIESEYNELYSEHLQLQSMDDLDELKRRIYAKKHSKSQFIKKYLTRSNIRTHSNGESAIAFFSSHIMTEGFYLLEEPENSLSPAMQIQLIQFLEEQVRFFGCQFAIATHSPFILSMKGTLIYNMDAEKSPRADGQSCRMAADLFMSRRNEFGPKV